MYCNGWTQVKLSEKLNFKFISFQIKSLEGHCILFFFFLFYVFFIKFFLSEISIIVAWKGDKISLILEKILQKKKKKKDYYEIVKGYVIT